MIHANLRHARSIRRSMTVANPMLIAASVGSASAAGPSLATSEAVVSHDSARSAIESLSEHDVKQFCLECSRADLRGRLGGGERALCSIRQGLLVIAQAAGFWAISEAGYALTRHFSLALPGNLVGMVMLFVLMACGIVKLEWVNAGATFLLRHLAFFFIPIAVGLMTMGDLVRSHGIAILAVLVASAAAGILISGLVVQGIAGRRPAGSATKELTP